MSNLNMTCECGKMMYLDKLKLQEKQHSQNLYRVFFACPHCGKEYFVCYHNDETHLIQAQIKEAERNGQRVKAEAYKRKLKKVMDELNNH